MQPHLSYQLTNGNCLGVTAWLAFASTVLHPSGKGACLSKLTCDICLGSDEHEAGPFEGRNNLK